MSSSVRSDGSGILAEVFRRIRRMHASAWHKLNLRNLYLSSPYAIVELTDGSQGVALNLEHEAQPFRVDEDRSAGPGRDWRVLAEEWLEQSRREPLLADTVLAGPPRREPHAIAVQVAILNALSHPLNGRTDYLRGRGLTAPDHPTPLTTLTRKGDVVGVVGFRQHGFRQALYDPNVRRVLVSDPLWSRSSEMRSQAEGFLEYYAEKLEFLDDGQGAAVVAAADVAVIAGSTLCDGTMDGLLRAASSGRCREVIVRGHSAGILSEVLFDRGVTVHVPSRIRGGFLAEARSFMDKIRRRKGLRVLSEVRTVLEEDNFHDFIDLRLKPVMLRERRLSLAAVTRRLKRRANGRGWGSSSLRALPASHCEG